MTENITFSADMKITDLVPPSIPRCFSPGFDASQSDDFVLRKFDVLQYIQFLRSSDLRSTNSHIFNLVARRIEEFGVGRTGRSIMQYVLKCFSFHTYRYIIMIGVCTTIR